MKDAAKTGRVTANGRKTLQCRSKNWGMGTPFARNAETLAPLRSTLKRDGPMLDKIVYGSVVTYQFGVNNSFIASLLCQLRVGEQLPPMKTQPRQYTALLVQRLVRP